MPETERGAMAVPAEAPSQIFSLMPKLMAAIGAVPRSQRNREFGYRYRSIDDVLNALQPALCELGITTAVRIHECKLDPRLEDKPRGGGQRDVVHAYVRLEVGFHASDGSAIWCGGVGEAIDYGGDKAATKAQVMAYKYAVTLGLAIPVADLADGDAVGASATGPETERMAAATQTASSAVRRYVHELDAPADRPCLPEQIDAIKRVAQALTPALDAHELKAIIRRRGAETLSQLTIAQAKELLDRLVEKQTAQAATSLF